MSISMDTSMYQSLIQQTKSSNNASSISGALSKVSSGDATDEELMEVCKSFESYLVEQVLKKTKEAMTNDEEEEGEYLKMFGDNLQQQYAQMITDTGSIGLAQKLYDSIKSGVNGTSKN